MPALSSISVHLPNIGEIEYVRSPKARRVSIYVRAGKPVKVAVPGRVSFSAAESFVETKLPWIEKQVRKCELLKQRQTLFLHSNPEATRYHALDLDTHEKQEIKVRLQEGVIKVRHPEHIAVTDEQVQSAIRKGMEAAFRAEAKYFLPQRLAELAARCGLQYQNVTIKNTRTRWGSCSSTNNINLSLHLMRLPAELCDYVLLHELAHIVEKNHGPRFWKYLDRICPNSKALDRQLKAYRIGIF